MKLPVVTLPHPILRQKAKPVAKITPELVKLAHTMLETMRASNGIGLAAPQIGQSIRLFVAGASPTKGDRTTIPTTILFNPTITKRSKTTTKTTEGCLSIPNLTGVVERAKTVTVQGLDETGTTKTIEASDLYARVMQHEIDHLDGVLFTDRLQHFKVVFYGTSDFALPALQELINHPQFDVVAVVTETDKPGGRGHQLLTSPVKQLASKNKIPVLQPSTLRSNHKDAERAKEATATIQTLQKLHSDFQIIASYGKILPIEVLEIPTFLNLNIHPSLLPLYRGPSPIQSAILQGETETGVAIMIVAPEMDAGPILTMYKYTIEPNETAGQLTERLSLAGAEQLIITLEEIVAEKAQIYEQNKTEATFTAKLEPAEGKIDWTQSALEIHNHVRAFSPKPGAFTEIEGQHIKIIQTHIQDGRLIIDKLLLPGKKIMSLPDLKNGYSTLFHALQAQIDKLS